MSHAVNEANRIFVEWLYPSKIYVNCFSVDRPLFSLSPFVPCLFTLLFHIIHLCTKPKNAAFKLYYHTAPNSLNICDFSIDSRLNLLHTSNQHICPISAQHLTSCSCCHGKFFLLSVSFACTVPQHSHSLYMLTSCPALLHGLIHIHMVQTNVWSETDKLLFVLGCFFFHYGINSKKKNACQVNWWLQMVCKNFLKCMSLYVSLVIDWRVSRMYHASRQWQLG